MSRDSDLRQALRDFVERMHDLMSRLHNAIEQSDTEAQHLILEAMVGNIEMLRAEIGDEPEDS